MSEQMNPLTRAHFHATYNGGWHGNDEALKAFHHGMDTVFNALDNRKQVLGDVDASCDGDVLMRQLIQQQLVTISDGLSPARTTQERHVNALKAVAMQAQIVERIDLLAQALDNARDIIGDQRSTIAGHVQQMNLAQGEIMQLRAENERLTTAGHP